MVPYAENGPASRASGLARCLYRPRHDQVLTLVRRSVPTHMALPFGETQGARDPRALAILAKTIYRELRASGFEERDVIALAGELLDQVASEVKGKSVRPPRA
jgi:hypothetical protein